MPCKKSLRAGEFDGASTSSTERIPIEIIVIDDDGCSDSEPDAIGVLGKHESENGDNAGRYSKDGEQNVCGRVKDSSSKESGEIIHSSESQYGESCNDDSDTENQIHFCGKRNVFMSGSDQSECLQPLLVNERTVGTQYSTQAASDDADASQVSVGVQYSQNVCFSEDYSPTNNVTCKSAQRKVIDHLFIRENGVTELNWRVEESCTCCPHELKVHSVVDSDTVKNYGRIVYDYLASLRRTNLIEFLYIISNIM